MEPRGNRMYKFNESYIGLRSDLLKFISGTNLNVLDVGCATGVNGAYLIENGIAKKVVGIEYDIEMADRANQVNTKVFCGDLNDKQFRESILHEELLYDVILFGDILEHLYDPWVVLRAFKSRLSTNGVIIISLPNIQHIELFIQVYLKGKWPRNERGIFDRTHLRWFTKQDAIDMIQEAGLKMSIYEPTFRSRDAIGSKFNWKHKILKRLDPKLVTFQHKLVCSHA